MSAPDLYRESLDLSEAADYLGARESKILLAVEAGLIPVGVMGRGWTGIAFPQGAKWPRMDWECHYGGPSPLNADLRIFHYRHPAGADYTVHECRVVQFWYLNHTTAWEAIRLGAATGPLWFQSHDGAQNHQDQPLMFPWSEFIVCVFKANTVFRWEVKPDDFLFLLNDLDALKEMSEQAAVPREWGFSHDTKLMRIAREVVRDHWEGQDFKRVISREAMIPHLMEKYTISHNEAKSVDILTRHDSKRRIK